MNQYRIRVYKDRKGKWRWRMQAPNGRIIGASTESYEKRKMVLTNLTTVTGIQITRPPHSGGFWRKVSYLDLQVRRYL